MPKVVKIVLDTADHHPLHKEWVKLAKAISEELGVELNIINEDYLFAINHGETDDLGMASLPQLFAVLEDGAVKLLLSKYPFDPVTAKPSEEMAFKEVREKLSQLSA